MYITSIVRSHSFVTVVTSSVTRRTIKGHSLTFINEYYLVLINKTLMLYVCSDEVLGKSNAFKVEYYANENPLQISEKLADVGQRIMYPIIKIRTLTTV